MSMHSSDAHTTASDRTFIAHYSDGQSARSDQARVRFTARGLEIDIAEGQAPKIWPYGALKTSEPLSSQSIEALVSYSYEPGATVFIGDPVFARALGDQAPHLTARAERWRQARPWIWAAAGAVLLFIGISLAQIAPAQMIASWLPNDARKAMGKSVVSSMTANRTVCEEPAGRAALDRLVTRLNEGAEPKKSFDVVVVDWSLVNAFAAPGERIVLTRGLIEKSGGPDELAGVLAHEMGHGLSLHPEAGIVRSLGLSALAQLMFGGGGGNLSNLGVALTQLAYSRGAEREADQHAITLLRDAEISTEGLAGFFRKVAPKERRGGFAAFDLLRSHPATKERIDTVEAVATYPSRPALNNQDWAALQGICPVKTDPAAAKEGAGQDG